MALPSLPFVVHILKRRALKFACDISLIVMNISESDRMQLPARAFIYVNCAVNVSGN